MEIFIVNKEHIEHVWPDIEKFVADALTYFPGRYTTDDIKNGFLNENRQLWIAVEDSVIFGVVGTHVVNYPQTRTLFMHFIGGNDGLRWKAPMLKVLQSFAKSNGCSRLEAQGRPGWKKIFDSDGLKTYSVCFDIPVE